MKAIYLSNRFYILIATGVGLFVMSYFFPLIYKGVYIYLILQLAALVYDYWNLSAQAKVVKGARIVDAKMSLSDHQEIVYTIGNHSKKALNVNLIDELPFQLQHREDIATFRILKESTRRISHDIRPTKRGEYGFGNLYAYLSSDYPGLMQYKIALQGGEQVTVYPSILQMKKYALQIFSKTASNYGIRKIRTIGENDEFEHIREYSNGDNIKSINWKATSGKAKLLVNQYQDTRSQMVYCVIDKGRTMQQPFDGLTLLDYAINSSLVIANIVLRKYDNAGLITFSNKVDDLIPAKSNLNQLDSILQRLYGQTTLFLESDFKLLYFNVRRYIAKRSILFIYTNFEDKFDLTRNLPYIKLINKYHLLILVNFVNTEVESAANAPAYEISDIYKKAIAKSSIIEKEIIAKELKSHGIEVILTKPQELSINVINKYLEIKAKRMK